MKAAFILPPCQSFYNPYSSPAVLSKWLSSEHGIESEVIDSGVEWLCYELRHSELLSTIDTDNFNSLRTTEPYQDLFLLKSVFTQCQVTLAKLCQPFAPEWVDLSGAYKTGNVFQGWSDVRSFAIMDEERLFDRYTRQSLIPQLELTKPIIVGLCLPFDWMIVPAMRLAYLIKQSLPKTEIIIGGNVVERLWNTGHTDYFSVQDADWACVTAGETALSELVDLIKSKRSHVETLVRLSNTHSTDGEYTDSFESKTNINKYTLRRFNTTPVLKISPSLKSSKVPDYTGYELANYFRPNPILSIPTSQGCFYGKCNFCSRQRSDQKVTYYEVKAQAVFASMETISTETGATQFILADDIVTRRLMKALATLISDSPNNYIWFCEASFKESMVTITQNEANLLYQGGCRIILNGLESASQHVRSLMGIKMDLSAYENTISKLSTAGIIPYNTVIFGYPGETSNDLNLSLQFIRKYANDSVFATSNFYALEGTPLFSQLENENGSECLKRSIVDAGHEYSGVNTVTKEEIQTLARLMLPGMFGPFQQFLRSITVLMELSHTNVFQRGN